ncbi:hypothetical protein KGF56_003344 [Candida oxycetoniae]|uniref:Octanoyltransferase n=1 Tax=Candida oxycetoniae TaxID=497107 RepID=A0AAI9SW97_9ASCO|nr:uncharacterized protein KGF56_003344 [Candida oxycetoniae]KAI3403914.2 hypothetical protein KGF56_003344 [Candida oxycetoniae]
MIRIQKCFYHAIRDTYKTLEHIHTTGTVLYQYGLDIQQIFIEQNLSFKKIESSIRRFGKTMMPLQVPNSIMNKHYNLQPPPLVLTFEFQNTYAAGLKSKKELTASQIAAFEQFRPDDGDCDSVCDGDVAEEEKADPPTTCFHQLDRGGQVTWHGRGQLVAYVVLDLKSFYKLSAKCFVNNVLLKSIQNVLEKKYGIESYLSDANPGVWVKDNGKEEEKKIASVGIKVSHGITQYGIALNISPNLKYLNTFEMCGLKNKKATSIKEVLANRGSNSAVAPVPSVEEVAELYTSELGKLLGMNKIEKTIL